MTKQHVHAEVIHAYADGKTIQRKYKDGPWLDFHFWDGDPLRMVDGAEYRVKPTPPAKVYPVTRMTWTECAGAYNQGKDGLISLANAALRHAIDGGQLVDAHEANVICARKDTSRDMAIAIAVRTACMYGRYTIPGEEGIDLAAIIDTVKD